MKFTNYLVLFSLSLNCLFIHPLYSQEHLNPGQFNKNTNTQKEGIIHIQVDDETYDQLEKQIKKTQEQIKNENQKSKKISLTKKLGLLATTLLLAPLVLKAGLNHQSSSVPQYPIIINPNFNTLNVGNPYDGDLYIDANRQILGKNAPYFNLLKNDYIKQLQPEFDILYESQQRNTTPAGSEFPDAPFDQITIQNLAQAFEEFTKYFSTPEDKEAIVNCGFDSANELITLSKEQVNNAISKLFKNVIAVGGFNKPAQSGEIYLGYTYIGLTYTVPGTDLTLYSFNINTHDDSMKLDRLPVVIFHELLHQFGLYHQSNHNQQGQNRGQLIFALEGCMLNFMRNKKGKKDNTLYYILGGVGGAVLITACGIVAYYKFKRRN